MRYIVSMTVAVLSAAVLYIFLNPSDAPVQGELAAPGQQEPLIFAPQSMDPVPPGVASRQAVAPAPPATAEQKQAAREQEAKLRQLARDYEDVRSDPGQRAAYREQMKTELAAYNENILPVVLEMAESATPPP